MQPITAGKAHMECHNQAADTKHRCVRFGPETQRSKWDTPPKVVENHSGKGLLEFQIQTDKQVMKYAVMTDEQRQQHQEEGT